MPSATAENADAEPAAADEDKPAPVITGQPDADADPEALIRDLTELLTELSKDLPYQLAMTVGYAICKDPTVPMSECLRRADAMLYERKSRLGVGR